MTQMELDLYESLNFHKWYSELISNFICKEDEILRKHDRKKVEEILTELGYCYTYYSSSKIFNVSSKFSGVNYFCNPEIKGGLVRVYLYAENTESNKRIGDNLISTCRLMEIAKNNDSGRYMLLPRFRNYQELKQILQNVFNKFEEFKLAVHNSRILESHHPA